VHTLLISDLHLTPERPRVVVAFENFLQQEASGCDALYILGDLFEAWIGDDDPAPLSRRVIEALAALNRRGTQLYFTHGNRDFAVGKRFARETGCHILDDHCVKTLYGRRYLLLHGDTLCSDDKTYQRVRRLTRNPMLLALLRNLPLATRQKIAEGGRARSAAHTGNQPDYILDVNSAAVSAALMRFQVDTMIHGHTHRPGDHRVALPSGDTGRRIVLGDWDTQGWVVRVDATGPTLSSFPIESLDNRATRSAP